VPAFRLLVHLHEIAPRAITQNEAARTLDCSQPTVSRAVAQLRRAGLARSRSTWTGNRSARELSWGLTPSGERAARRAWAQARELPTGDPQLRLGDLLDLDDALSLTDLLARPPADWLAGDEALRRRQDPYRPGAPTGAEPSTTFVGRWDERREIVRVLVRARASPAVGQVRLILGPAGQGKSRLLQFAATIGARRGFHVVRGAVLRDSGIPMSPFGEMIPRLDPTEAPGATPESLALPQRMLRDLERIERAARSAPLLLIVDDLEAADPVALGFFRFLGHNLPSLAAPVVLLAAARNDEPSAGAAGAAYADLLRAVARPGTSPVPVRVLPALSEREAREVAGLVGHGAGPSLPGRTVARIVSRARGNPLYLIEGMREALDAARRAALAGSTSVETPLPPSLRRLLELRLAQLPAADRALLEGCALLEEEFPVEPLEALRPALGFDSLATIERRLGELADAWALLERRGPHRFGFAHPLFPEALRDRAHDRPARAKALADWWRDHRPGDIARIAGLYRLAGDPAAVPWLRRALEGALRERTYEATEEICRSLREMVDLGNGDRANELALELALLERLWLAGAQSVLERVARGLLDWGAEPRERVLAHCYLLVSLVYRAPQEARVRLDALPSLLRAVPRSHLREVRGAATAAAAYCRLAVREWEAAATSADAALRDLADRPGTLWALSAALSRSFALAHLGRYRAAVATLQETARRVGRERGSLFAALLWQQRGTVESLLGRPAQGRRYRERAARVAREVANPNVLAEALSDLVLSQLETRQIDAAEETVRELQQLVERFELPYMAPWLAYREGQIRWRQGRWPEAVAALRRAEDGFRRATDRVNALLPAAYLLSTERRPRKLAQFRSMWRDAERLLNAEEVAAIDPLREGVPLFTE